MINEKNLTSNNGTVDEELLRSFFAGSVRMHIADNGFSRNVMQRLQEEVPARQRMIYNLWTALWSVACIVAFFLVDGIDIIRGYLSKAAVYASSLLPKVDLNTLRSQPDFHSIMSHIQASGSTIVMVMLTVVVLSSVVLWDAEEQSRG